MLSSERLHLQWDKAKDDCENLQTSGKRSGSASKFSVRITCSKEPHPLKPEIGELSAKRRARRLLHEGKNFGSRRTHFP